MAEQKIKSMIEEKIKCVVWDLDNTIWDGVLIENDEIQLKENVVTVIKELDRKGFLQSISSKNDYDLAKEKLEEFGLWDYFIYPKISWNSKSDAIAQIAKDINIGINTLSFVDDQEFEREEVLFSLPEVLCIDAADIDKISAMERMTPKFITNDSAKRRKMYQNDIKRNQIEQEYIGTKEEFLETLDMVFTIDKAKVEDLQRAEELTVRTHQLNSTGYVYSYDELKHFIEADDYEVYVAQLDDKFGTYGKIGLALIEKKDDEWDLKLLLMSCRVMSKGVGNVFMNYIINEAKKNNKILRAQFIPTDRNKIMYVTYKFNGFKEAGKEGDVVIFEADMSYSRKIPVYVKLVCEGSE
ncbi:HAD-IIIC family phosphatase [Bacillus wiedmannii]|uniref:HAD-IIIC family phosphatase n=1 Tax=Bacillus wiedmannii TaxID=1890302 RepID=UPI001CB8B2A5|nr:HAD-IIIC family phosphatase [Bacillus wiedmannii]